MHHARIGLLFAAMFFTANTALAADDSELSQLRDEMKELRRNYEERIQALEKRLTEAEGRTAKPETAAAQPALPDVQSAPPPPATAASAFNPGISLILQGTWARTQQDPNNFQISGFAPSGGEVGPPRRSFGLGESELLLTASIDPYFRGTLIAALTPDNRVEVEEAFFQTLALPKGLTLKAGRFLSGIGYQNEIHQHAWDFQDTSLPYKAFLGGRFQQDGLQLRWLAPTPVFLELGAEIGGGRAFPGNDQNKNGASAYALLAHLGGDIGESYAWRAGMSYLKTSATNRAFDDVDSTGSATTNSFTGRTQLFIVDGVLKWSPDGNSTRTNFKLQGEYFRTRERGTLAYDDSPGRALYGPLSDAYRTAQSGWYAQAVYQFLPRWRVGYRYDALKSGTPQIAVVDNGLGPTAGDFSLLAPYDPTRNTVMAEFNPTEFSRFRLQYAVDKSRRGFSDQQFLVQYIHSLGPHGAHKF